MINGDDTTTLSPSTSIDSTTASGSNLPPPPDPNRKGRYWNYEMNRWSYCSSDEDEEDEEKARREELGEKVKENGRKNDGSSASFNPELLNEKQEDTQAAVVENGIVENTNNPVEKQEGAEDDDYEWEYFYEDVEVAPNKKNADQALKIKSPIPKRLEPLVKQTTENQIKIGQVANEGAIKLSKDVLTTQTPTSPQPGPSGKKQRVNPRDGWECPTCTLLNEPTRPGCEACTSERPADYVIPPPGPADTIPRNSSVTTQQNGNQDTPTLKVVAATVTKNEQVSKGAAVTEGKVSSNSNTCID